MTSKEEVLKKIAANMEKIKQLYADCEKISNDSGVVINITEPIKENWLTYYPHGFETVPNSEELSIAQNYGYDTIAGMWISSSDRCN